MTERAERVAAEVRDRDLDMMLVTGLTNLRWLTGFKGTNGAALCGPDRRVFVTDFRYAEAAEMPGWRVEVVTGDWNRGLAGQIRSYATGAEVRVGYEDDGLTVRTLRRLEEALLGAPEQTEVTLATAGGLVEGLRRRKDERELEGIVAAAALADQVFREAAGRGLVGRSEREVVRFAVDRLRDEGAEPAFPPIVATGANGARPHAEPGDRLIEAGDLVVFDMGADLDGYCSDCTRTIATGEVGDRQREVYEVVLAAQRAALEALRSGAQGRGIDSVARAVIEVAGYGERFGHGLGHGVGMEVHEAPRLSPLSEDTLIAGDVVTVEPGVYLPGEFGVRIEDLVVVTEDGCRILTGLPKELGAELA